MQTNYDKLSAFEACAVFAAVIGLVLIGFEIYITLPQHQKNEVADAFTMFDLHEHITTVADKVEFVFEVGDEFYKQFYIAFSQVFSFPDQVGTPVLKFASAFESYSQSVAYAYQMNNANQVHGGEVLGVILIRQTSSEPQTIQVPVHAPYKNQIQYYYHAPAVVKQLINN